VELASCAVAVVERIYDVESSVVVVVAAGGGEDDTGIEGCYCCTFRDWVLAVGIVYGEDAH
jgi:hypothetical protein